MIDTLIKNAVALTMTDENTILHDCCICIDKGKIQYIGVEPPPMLMDARRIIDAHGDIVMPGLINAHAHTAMCLMRGYADDYPLQSWLFDKVFPVEARLDQRAVVAGATLGIAEMLASGTTSFSDMYFYQPAVAEAVAAIGIRANLCNAVIAMGDSYDFDKDSAVLETYELIANFHNANDGLIRADVAIHAEYTSSPTIWERVHSIAERNGLITQIHLSETKKEHDDCIARYGVTPAAILNQYGVFDTPVLAAHGVWLNEADMDLLVNKDVSLAHCPVSNLKLGSGIADIKSLAAKGVNVCLGTDGACSNNSLDMFEELKLSALLSKGVNYDPSVIKAYTALKMATANGAKAQGRDKQTGILAVGYDADIIMLGCSAPRMRPIYNPIATVAYSTVGSNVELTMVKGNILYEKGVWKTIDIEKAVYDVESYAVPIIKGK